MQNREIQRISKFTPLIAEEAERLLNRQGIAQMFSYAWPTPNDPDPEYQGHAIWQTSPPLDSESDPNAASEIVLALMVAGADFEGLMNISRATIGMALVHVADAIQSAGGTNDWFWLHHMHAILTMSIASDRIRDYAVLGIHRSLVSGYQTQSKRHTKYVTPFVDARALLEAVGQTGWLDSADQVPDLARQVFEFKKKRNSFVHEAASEFGRNEKELAEHARKGSNSTQPGELTPEEEDRLIEALHKLPSKRRKDLADAVLELKKWYKLLMDLSNHVFRLEYCMRTEIRTSKGKSVYA